MSLGARCGAELRVESGAMGDGGAEFKLGAHGREGIVRHRFAELWQRDHKPTPRLQIATGGSYVDLMLKLAKKMLEPYQILYVLVVPRLSERPPGRYERRTGLTFDELDSFLNRYRVFLERDARHHLWVSSGDERASLLVLDKHDFIYAYGQLEEFEGVLTDLGMVEGQIQLPFPHSHHYHPTMDLYEEELITQHEWIWSALQPEDEA